MNEVQIFNFKENSVRTQYASDEVWFCLKDVCDVLEIKNSNDVVSRINPKGVASIYTLTKGGNQKLTYINESNLYKVIFQSRKPQAEEFTEWVTGEVLPTIRKTGSYSLQKDSYMIEDPIERAKRWIEEQEERKALENENPLDILAYQYDIVCNGVELSSGAVRNHDIEIMLKAFTMAGYKEEEVKNKFGALYKAFQYGAPPHAGIAPGIDRMLMLLSDSDTIREVIAFPLNSKAQDLMMGAPGNVRRDQLRDVHILIDKK